MIIGVVADVHLTNPTIHGGPTIVGVNARARQILECIETVHDVVGVEGGLIVAGDLFDTCKPTPQLILELGEILRRFGMVWLILGNHDMHSSAVGDNALTVLSLLPNVRVIERPTVIEPFLMLPFGYDITSPGLDDLDGKLSPIVLAHHGIRDDNMAKWTRDKGVPAGEIADWLVKTGRAYYLAGDWHPHRQWAGGRIQQIGALCPVDWRNPGLTEYGGLYVIDTSKQVPLAGYGLAPQVKRQVVPGPRFVVSSEPGDLPLPHPHARWLYVRAKYPAVFGTWPPGAVVEDPAEVTTVEGEVRVVADHITDMVESEDLVTQYVDGDSNIPSKIKNLVCEEVLSCLRA